MKTTFTGVGLKSFTKNSDLSFFNNFLESLGILRYSVSGMDLSKIFKNNSSILLNRFHNEIHPGYDILVPISAVTREPGLTCNIRTEYEYFVVMTDRGVV